MKILLCEQRSPEWYAARLGVPSASDFDKIVTMKGETSKQVGKYLFKLAGEKVSGKCEETYQNAAMLNGIQKETEARQLYEMINDVKVDQVGFCLADDGSAGCSPDGLIGEEGGLEIKCPTISTHVEYLLDGLLPSEYFQQVQGNLYITERKWWDFMSYYPGLKPFIIRVYPNFKFIDAFDKQIKEFSVALKETIIKIQ